MSLNVPHTLNLDKISSELQNKKKVLKNIENRHKMEKFIDNPIYLNKELYKNFQK